MKREGMRLLCPVFLCLVFSLAACGGGSRSSDGTVVQGTLTERGTGHSKVGIQAKHSSGERIGDVKVCVLDECSITDDLGQWGVNIENFPGGDITVVLDGHGISTSVSTNVPASAKDIEMDLDHAGNQVTIAKLMIDGEDHTGHSHDHNS